MPQYSTDKAEANNIPPPGSAPGMQSLMELTQNSTILEQAWMMNLAGEIARRIQEGKAAGDATRCAHLHDGEHPPPPAYQQ
jgi:distribution and morphology protein 34